MRILFYLFLGCLITLKANAQTDSLSLLEAIETAQIHALKVKNVQKNYSVAQYNYLYNAAELKPQVSLNSTLPNFFKSTSAITQPDGTISFRPISQDNSSLNLNVSQRLLNTNTLIFAESHLRRYNDFTEGGLKNFNSVPFRFGIEQPLNYVNTLKWNKRFLELEKQITLAAMDINKEELAAEVTLAFFDLLGAQINLKIATTNAQNSDKIYEIAQERDKLGKISQSDLLQLELSLNQAKQNTINAQREVIGANARLKKSIGWDLDQDEIYNLKVPQNLFGKDFEIKNKEDLAWNKRPESKQYEKLWLEASQALEMARKKHAWQGSLSATWGWVGTGGVLEQSYKMPQVENFVQLGLKIPIIDGGKKKYSTKAAIEQQNYIEAEKEYTEATFKQNIRQLAQQYQALKIEAELGEKSLELAEKRYGIANERFILNQISITDLNLAFTERDSAWRSYVHLLRAYWVSYYTLRALTLENI